MVLGILSLSHARSLSFYRSEKGFGYALGRNVASEEMRLLKSRMHEREKGDIGRREETYGVIARRIRGLNKLLLLPLVDQL